MMHLLKQEKLIILRPLNTVLIVGTALFICFDTFGFVCHGKACVYHMASCQLMAWTLFDNSSLPSASLPLMPAALTGPMPASLTGLMPSSLTSLLKQPLIGSSPWWSVLLYVDRLQMLTHILNLYHNKQF